MGHASREAPPFSSRNRHQYRRAHRAGDGAASAAASRNGNDSRSRISNGHEEGKSSSGSKMLGLGLRQGSSRTDAKPPGQVFETKNRRRLWGTSGGRRDIRW